MVSVELMGKGGRCAALGTPSGTWFTLLDIPGVEIFFNTRRTNDPIDCTHSKAHKLADLTEVQESLNHWFSGIDKSEGKALLIASPRNCKGSRAC